MPRKLLITIITITTLHCSTVFAQKLKYKDVFPMLANKNYELGIPTLQTFLSDPKKANHPNGNLQMGLYYEIQTNQYDLIKDSTAMVYTWTANAIANNATYSITDLVKNTNIDDYRIYLHVANTPVVSVNADAPYKTFGDLLNGMKSGDNITVGTAGVNSSGGMAIAALNEAGGGNLSYRMVAYDGGAPAVVAAASGEVTATTQLAVEQSEMMRAGKIRALAVLASTPLVINGVDPVPPITQWLPDMPIAPDYFGVFIPVGAPQEVYDTMDKVWAEHVMNAEALKTYASDRGATFDPSYGETARALSMPVVIAEACARVTRNEAIVHPREIGIDCDKMAEIK